MRWSGTAASLRWRRPAFGGVEPRVAAVAGVHADQHVVLDDPLSQNGSNSGSANDRGPRKPGTGKCRADQDATRTALGPPYSEAPRSPSRRSARVMTGVVKMRFSVVEAPDLIEPLVQRMDQDVDGDRRSSRQPALREGWPASGTSGCGPGPSSFISSQAVGPGSKNAGIARIGSPEQLALGLAVRVAGT